MKITTHEVTTKTMGNGPNNAVLVLHSDRFTKGNEKL